MKLRSTVTHIAAALSLITLSAQAAPAFVNALVIDGATVDASGGTLVNDGRMGFFSDLYYDAARNEMWNLDTMIADLETKVSLAEIFDP